MLQANKSAVDFCDVLKNVAKTDRTLTDFNV
jgi:hypothetical protein